AKLLIGGCWSFWWLKTPLPGVFWLNCPHMPNLSGLKVEDLTRSELEGRARIARLLDFAGLVALKERQEDALNQMHAGGII
ncbi:hypothetical protein ACC704_37900, partial [Rhizobium johnstonii]